MDRSAVSQEVLDPQAKRNAARVFWLFALIWFGIWTIMPAIMMPAPSNYDVIEHLILGREWTMGSAHHPPFSFWAMESMYQICGRHIWASYVLGTLFSILGLWAVWRLSRYYVSESLALLVVFSSAAYRYFNMGNINFTSSIPPTIFWTLAIYQFFLAVKFNRLPYWFLLGGTLGIGMLSKYSMILLVVTMIAYLIWDREARKYWLQAGPWVTSVTAILLFLPHFLWMVQNDFPPVRFAATMVTGSSSFLHHIKSPACFFGAQFLVILPMILAFTPICGCFWQIRRRKPDPSQADYEEDRFRRRFLNFMIFVPLLIMLITVVLSNRERFRPAYGSTFWTLMALWYAQYFQILHPERIRRAFQVAFLILGITVVCFWADHYFRYWMTDVPGHVHFPARALAVELDRIWHEKGADGPCPLMSGDWKLVGSASLYMQGRPSILFYYDGMGPGSKPHGFWATDEDLARKGGLIVWKAEDGDGCPGDVPEYVGEKFPTAVVAPETISVPWNTKAKLEPLHVRYAIVSPTEKP